MKELLRTFEDLWVSVAFAEAGEHEAVQQFLAEQTHNDGREICQTA